MIPRNVESRSAQDGAPLRRSMSFFFANVREEKRLETILTENLPAGLAIPHPSVS